MAHTIFQKCKIFMIFISVQLGFHNINMKMHDQGHNPEPCFHESLPLTPSSVSATRPNYHPESWTIGPLAFPELVWKNVNRKNWLCMKWHTRFSKNVLYSKIFLSAQLGFHNINMKMHDQMHNPEGWFHEFLSLANWPLAFSELSLKIWIEKICYVWNDAQYFLNI